MIYISADVRFHLSAAIPVLRQTKAPFFRKLSTYILYKVPKNETRFVFCFCWLDGCVTMAVFSDSLQIVRYEHRTEVGRNGRVVYLVALRLLSLLTYDRL